VAVGKVVYGYGATADDAHPAHIFPDVTSFCLRPWLAGTLLLFLLLFWLLQTLRMLGSFASYMLYPLPQRPGTLVHFWTLVVVTTTTALDVSCGCLS